MKIAVIGASAGVGLEATRRALAQQHHVTTLSRRLEPLPSHPRQRKIQGSATNLADVKAAVEGSESILVTLGTGSSTKATTLFSDAARTLLQALLECGSTAPLIVLTGFGTGDSRSYLSLPVKILLRLVMHALYADKGEMESLISAAYPRWEMVRPGQLTDGPMTARYRVLDGLTKGMKVGAISRADVAHFLVAEAESPTYLGTYPVLTT